MRQRDPLNDDRPGRLQVARSLQQGAVTAMATQLLAGKDRHDNAVFERDDELDAAGHEMVLHCRDDVTGLRAIICVHDTTLGPALGGTRFCPYPSEADALTDCLRLSQGMTFKAAAAGLPLGGGKAVIIGDPATLKSPELLRAYGRFVDRLGGTYVTAADVGTTCTDLDIVGEVTRHVVGRTKKNGGSGDSGLSTALGVLHAMRAAARLTWGDHGLRNRVVGVEGAGKVGFHLVRLLLDEGAEVLVCDPSASTVHRVQAAYPAARIVSRVMDSRLDVYAPCALGGTLTTSIIRELEATVICGAANNQLLTQEVGDMLAPKGMLWVPDFVANAGGLIQVGGELVGNNEAEVMRGVRQIEATVTAILERSLREGISTSTAAMDIVRRHLHYAAAGNASRDE